MHTDFLSDLPWHQAGSGGLRVATRENPRVPLVGREREQDELASCLSTTGGVVALSGDPGMGKSTLLAWAAERATAQGMTVLTGRVGEFERSIPFGVFADALHEHWNPQTDLSATARHAVHREVRALLERLGTGRGLLLVLDDLHWADAASIELVHHLVRHQPRGVVIACAYRPRQLRLDSGSIVHIELGPLALEDAALLLGVPAGQCGQVFEASGGNPFYLEALSGGSASVDAALRGEMDAVRPQTRRLLQIAAVTADPFEPAVVAEIAQLSVEETLAALDELVLADLVRPEQDLRTYRFRHPTVRNVAYHSTSAAVRHSTHARAALVLERLGAPAETRAHHVEHAARRGDARAVAVLSSAARAVVHRAPATAAQWYASALALSDDEQWDLRWGHARALGLSGKLKESRAALHELLAVLPPDHDDRLRVVAFCAHVERALGKHAEVRALAARELAIMTPDTASAAVLKLVLAVSLLQVFESPEAIKALLDDVRAVARASGDQVLAAGADGVTALVSGDASHLGPAALAVDGATDHAVAERLESAVWVAWSELRLGRNRDALRHYERALSVALSTGQHHVLGNLLLGRANALRWLGCLAEAEAGAEESAEVAYLSGSADLHALTLAVHSWLLTLRGDHVRGLEVARRAVDVARSIEGWHPTIARLRVGHALLAAGSCEAALFELTSAGGGPELPRVPAAYRPEMYELITQAAIGCGDDATEWAVRASASAESLGLPGCLGFADLAWAHVHASRGESAVERASLAASRFSSVGQRLEEARAYLVMGEVQRAHAVFAECGVAVSSGDGLATLTKRERQVADLVGEGMTNRQVARQLRMAEKTVEGHLSRIFAKLEVRSRAGVARVLASSR